MNPTTQNLSLALRSLKCPQPPQSFLFTTFGSYPTIPYHYSALAQRILISSIPSSIESTIPSCKIARQITKLLRLNIFQCSLMHYSLSTNKFTCKQIHNNKALQQLLRYDESVYSNTKYAEVFLLLLFNGYYAKSVVNEYQEMEQVKLSVIKLIPSFGEAYDSWEERRTFRSISLKDVNSIFKKNSFVGPKEEVVENYNAIVDQILEMSKPYANKNGDNISQEESMMIREQIIEEEEDVDMRKKRKDKGKKERENQKMREQVIKGQIHNTRLKQKQQKKKEILDKKKARGKKQPLISKMKISQALSPRQQSPQPPTPNRQSRYRTQHLLQSKLSIPQPMFQQQLPPEIRQSKPSISNNSFYRLRSSNNIGMSLNRSAKYHDIIGEILEEPNMQNSLFNTKVSRHGRGGIALAPSLARVESNQSDNMLNGRFSVNMITHSGKNSFGNIHDSFKFPEIPMIPQISIGDTFSPQLIRHSKPQQQNQQQQKSMEVQQEVSSRSMMNKTRRLAASQRSFRVYSNSGQEQNIDKYKPKNMKPVDSEQQK